MKQICSNLGGDVVIPGVAFRKFIKGENGFKPDEHLKAGLAGIVDNVFQTEGKRLATPTPLYVWDRFAYLIVAIDMNLQTTHPFDLQNDIDAVVGLLHACLIFTPQTRVPIMLYDTIGTATEYRKDGIASKMISFARNVDSQYGIHYATSAKPKLIAGLKTPEIEKHNFYKKRSDIWFQVVNDNTGQMNYVHLFLPNSHRASGFAKGYPLQSIAQYIGDLPLKFVRI